MQPVRRRSLIDDVADSLRAEIRSGTWPVGGRLPNEAELSRRAGVGRNTVREAVQSLVHAGLVERRQGSGTYVLATSAVPGTMGRLLSAAERREAVELRLALDVSAAALAAERRTEADLEQLGSALERRRAAFAAGAVHEAADADMDLHRAVVAAAHNTVLLQVYDSVLPTLTAGVRDDMAQEEADDHLEHADVVHAVTIGDSDGAAAAARRLLLNVLARGGAGGRS